MALKCISKSEEISVYNKVKCKQTCPVFELSSSSPFPMTITTLLCTLHRSDNKSDLQLKATGIKKMNDNICQNYK